LRDGSLVKHLPRRTGLSGEAGAGPARL